MRKPRLYALIYTPLEKAPARPQPLVRRRLEKARDLEPIFQRRHRTLRQKPHNLHERGVGRHHTVRGDVILEFAEIMRVVAHAACVWNGRSVVNPGDRCDSLMSMFRASVDEWWRYTRDCTNSLVLFVFLKLGSASVSAVWPMLIILF